MACNPGLKCYKRNGDTKEAKIPGCLTGGSEDKAGKNYCHDPKKAEKSLSL